MAKNKIYFQNATTLVIYFQIVVENQAICRRPEVSATTVASGKESLSGFNQVPRTAMPSVRSVARSSRQRRTAVVLTKRVQGTSKYINNMINYILNKVSDSFRY